MNDIQTRKIQDKIFNIRGMQVMLDRDLADFYGVETRVINQAVKRNIDRFPVEFMFRLTKEEVEYWKSQIVISNKEIMGLRKAPFAFTEAGVAMLSAVLRSETAVKMSVVIIKAFVEMRKFIIRNADIFSRLTKLEHKQLLTDGKVDKLLNALQSNELKPKQGIFFNGQIFDAYKLISDIIRTADKSIILIDNYTDDTVLTLFTKRKKGVKTTIYCKSVSGVLRQDIEKYNSQYEAIEVKELQTAHDRFLILDEKIIYHFGASLKDLGKKWFAFSKLDFDAKDIIDKL
ncbi:MAG: ORF6N domain-containing protein [Ignavibacteriaceae bacterium]|nr:ORF6N domain-containing protein [Ignavibacteriaceae bacterium]